MRPRKPRLEKASERSGSQLKHVVGYYAEEEGWGRHCASAHLASLFSGIRETAALLPREKPQWGDAKHRGFVRTLKSQAPD